MAAAPTVRTIPIRHCNFEAKVKVAGNGPPLIYLHAAGGPIWDDFVEGLTERYTVYAPHHPGTGETVRESIYTVESLWDLVLIYDEMFDALKLSSVPVVGTSFGGMMACELAAHRPDRISKTSCSIPSGCGATTRRSHRICSCRRISWWQRCTSISTPNRCRRRSRCRTIPRRRSSSPIWSGRSARP